METIKILQYTCSLLATGLVTLTYIHMFRKNKKSDKLQEKKKV
ncbi:hypothetical protein [Bacillus alkalicellulosilyticus]|nr:hypothetical protein [Bacillus alkalicellulosilyticus]